MSALNLTENATTLIVAYIQANIGSALNDVATARQGVNPQVSLENPKSYFVYPEPQAYTAPAVFVISDDFDLRIQDKKANFIFAKHSFKISVIVEDQDAETLTYKAWRYQAALHAVLDEAKIVSGDSSLALKVIVYHHKFSPVFMKEKGQDQASLFRKEVVLECEVEHLENLYLPPAPPPSGDGGGSG